MLFNTGSHFTFLQKDTLRARISSQTPEFFKGNMRPPGSDIVIFLEKDFEDKRSDESSEEE